MALDTHVSLESSAAATASRAFRWFERHSRSVLFLCLALASVGAYLAFQIPVAVFPATNFPRVVISIDNGVMPIEQMMATITRPVEEAVRSVRGLRSVWSVTSRGSAEVDLFFDWKTDMFQSLQRANAALNQARSSLPATARIETHRLTFASFPIISYSLTSDVVPPTQLWELATYELKPRLNSLEGVSTVDVQGGQIPEFHIVPDPARLLAARVTVPEMLNAVRRTNLVESPGLVESRHQLVLGLVSGQVTTPDQIASIVVKTTPSGVPVRIGDLGSVVAAAKPVYTLVTANGQPAVLLSIRRQPKSNTLKVANEVHAEIETLRKELPPSIHLHVFYDQSDIVRESMKSVRDAILVGLFLAVVVIVAFLRDWGSSLVAGLVIPITILCTCIALKLLNQSFNLMTLGGLAAAVGLVIDDAIVVVENIVMHRDAGEGRIEAILSALREVAIPLVGSTVTPIVVFLPLIVITGVTGTFFRALAVTMSVALLTSLGLAMTWTPALSQYLIRSGNAGNADPPASLADTEQEPLPAQTDAPRGFFGRVIQVYERGLRLALGHPRYFALCCAALVAVAYVSYRHLGTDLLPKMDEGGFVLDYLMPPGSSLTETNRVLTHVGKILRSIPEVENISRRTGLQLGLAAVTEANRGDISVKLKKKRSRNIDEVIAEARERIRHAEPELNIEFIQVLQDMIGDLTSAPQPIQIKLFSPDTNELRQAGPRVAERIRRIHGVVDVLDGVENTISGPAVQFTVDPVAAARAGFTPAEVAEDAASLVGGQAATTPVVVGDRLYTIRVRMPEVNRSSLEAIRDTVLASGAGSTATLGSLASVTEVPGQLEIRRENLQRDMAVTARLEGTDLGTAMRRVKRAVAALHLPPTIRVKYGGTYLEQQKSFRDLLTVLVLALVLVFLVLLFEFANFSAPTAILCSAVLSTSGVFLALLLTRTEFNIASFMGLIMVVGIVAKNGILLLDAEHRYRRHGLDAEKAMILSGRRRLRPIAMTAVAAVAGMFPLALGLGAGSQMLQPLAIAVIGGILISMLLSLLVTPTVYYWLTREKPMSSY